MNCFDAIEYYNLHPTSLDYQRAKRHHKANSGTTSEKTIWGFLT